MLAMAVQRGRQKDGRQVVSSKRQDGQRYDLIRPCKDLTRLGCRARCRLCTVRDTCSLVFTRLIWLT